MKKVDMSFLEINLWTLINPRELLKLKFLLHKYKLKEMIAI